MNMVEFLAEATNKNLLLGVVPESIGLLIFGIILIVSAVSLRRLFKQAEEHTGFTKEARAVNSKERVLVGK